MTSSSKKQGQKHRDREAERGREHSREVSNIGQPPPCISPERREACRLNLRLFLVTYFPGSTGLSLFSADHERVIARIQEAILQGGRRLNACYRGFAKSTITENSAIWATLYGHRRLIPIFGADETSATNNLDSIKLELAENDLLFEDFPEICWAVRALEGRPQRRLSQSYTTEDGQVGLTHIEWNAEQIRYPVYPGSAGGGAVILTRGITGASRGLKIKMPDGTQQRPDFIFIDDPQTDEMAGSALQVGKTLSLIRKNLLKQGGHRRTMAVVCNATVIKPDDAVDQLLADPSWQGERIPMVRKWPDAHKTLWLERYADLRRTYDRENIDDQRRAHEAATAFYRDNRAAMDVGGEVSWASCFDPDTELSALQHAYNILIDDGEEAFASECQGQPLRPEDTGIPMLAADQIIRKINALDRGIVPAGAAYLTAFIDVQEKILIYTVAAWASDFTGSFISYGTYPKQVARSWTVRQAHPVLMDVAPPGTGTEGAIWAGLEKLTDDLIGMEWQGETGGHHKIDKILIDSGYKMGLVFQFCRQSKHASVIIPSRGFPIGAKSKPFAEYIRHPGTGEIWGEQWYITKVPSRQQKWARFSTNYWKGFLHNRLNLGIGDRGCLTLHQGSTEEHRLFAEQLVSERPVRVTANGRTVEEWDLKPGAAENHYLDCAVGCAVGASIMGATLKGFKEREKPKVAGGKKYSDLYKEARARDHKNGKINGPDSAVTPSGPDQI